MNQVTLLGRLTRDPELRTTTSQNSVATFAIAVDRKFKDANGEKQADFINCVAWRQTGENISKYFKKGSRILVTGAIQSRSWDDKDGKKHTAVEVIVDGFDFIDKTETKPSEPAWGNAVPESGDPCGLHFDI